MKEDKYVPACYQCNTKQNLKICSEYTAICFKCYDTQVQMAKYYKSQRQKQPQIDLITEGIYLGNQDAAVTQEILLTRNITAICVCGLNLETPFINNPKYSYKIYEIDDFTGQQIKPFFEQNYQWMTEMRNQNRNILLHCAAGISRSASFTIAYLMKWKAMGFYSAKQFVKQRRKIICPNSGFRSQLQEYQNELIAQGVIAAGSIQKPF